MKKDNRKTTKIKKKSKFKNKLKRKTRNQTIKRMKKENREYHCSICWTNVPLNELRSHLSVHKNEITYAEGIVFQQINLQKPLLLTEPPPKCILCSKSTNLKANQVNCLPVFRCACGFTISAKDSRSYRLLQATQYISTFDDLRKVTISPLHAECALIKSGWNSYPKCVNKECIKWINQRVRNSNQHTFCPAVPSLTRLSGAKSIQNFQQKCLNPKCKTKFSKLRENGWLCDIRIDTLKLLNIHVMLLKSELLGKTIINDSSISKPAFYKIQQLFRFIIAKHNIKKDVKLKGPTLEWDESHICGQNYIKSFIGIKPSKDSGGTREIKMGQICQKNTDGSTGAVKTFVMDNMLVETINPLMLDGIDLAFARYNTVNLRTDRLAQNTKTVNINKWPFKIKHKSWNHSDPKNPYVDPNDPTNQTQTVEQLHRIAKDEFPTRHKNIKNVRATLHVYEFKHNEKIKNTHDFAKIFAEVRSNIFLNF